MGGFEYKLWIHYKKLLGAGSECTKVAEWKRAIFYIQRSYFFSSKCKCLLLKNWPIFIGLSPLHWHFDLDICTHLPIPINYWNIIIFWFILFYDNWTIIKKIRKKNQWAKMEYSGNKLIDRSLPLWNKKDGAKKGSHPCHWCFNWEWPC